MGAVAFQKDFNQMNSGTEHPAIKGIHDTMDTIGVLGNAPWSLVLASCLPGATSGFAKFFGFCANQLKEIEGVSARLIIAISGSLEDVQN